jgi:hypothetical protein
MTFRPGDPMPAMGRWHHEREQVIRASGIPATFLRPGGFMTNALGWLPAIRDGGYVLDPVGPGRYAPVDPADIAAVAALAQEGHQGREYVLTGDEALTIAEQVQILSAATGLDIKAREPATTDEAIRARFPHGAPPALAEAFLEAITLMRADTTGLRTDTVQRLLGRKPATFTDWCARNAGLFQQAVAATRPRRPALRQRPHQAPSIPRPQVRYGQPTRREAPYAIARTFPRKRGRDSQGPARRSPTSQHLRPAHEGRERSRLGRRCVRRNDERSTDV